MKRPLRILARGVLLVVVLALGVWLGGWWLMRWSLPQRDGTARLPGLQRPVTVTRDAYGVPTIRAESLDDLLRAQGYVLAQDRLFQMDLIRRTAAGELSEVLGAVTLDLDKEHRRLGLRPAAEDALAGLAPETRRQLEAYAQGVNQFIETHPGAQPWEFRVLRYQPRPWTPVDTLLIHGYMFKILSETWEWEISRGKAAAEVGPERARDLFPVDSVRDRMVMGAVAGASSAPASPRKAARGSDAGAVSPMVAHALRWLVTTGRDAELRAGSNNWVVSGAHTYSGKPLLANDTHLPNDIPSLWYMAHLQAPGYNTKGFCLPGAPLVVIGHNEHIAWGFTNTGADVEDVYVETFNPENPRQYRVNGQWVEAQVRSEVIRVQGQADVVLEVVVTRHGPVVQREGNTGYAVKWTALQPGALGFGHSEIGRARNWPEFLAAMRGVTGPAQNGVYADVEGNIGFIIAARIPIRKKGFGEVPVPGDTDDFEWTSYIPFEQLPQVFNPPSGRIATANARITGPGYKPYITDRWFDPARTMRIVELLESHTGKFRPEDFIRIQADVFSGPHKFLAGEVARALHAVPATDPHVATMAARLEKWDGRARGDGAEPAVLDFLRRDLLEELLKPHLKGGAAAYQWSRPFVFLENVLRERPSRWLPPGYTTYDHLLAASLGRAVTRAAAQAGHRIPLLMLHPFGRSGFLRRHLSIADLPQDGTGYSVKQTGRTFGPAMRFVADLSDLDKSLMNITAGQSGHYLSPHYRDQFPAWYGGHGLASAFSAAREAAGRKHHLTLLP